MPDRTPPLSTDRYHLINRLTVAKAHAQMLARVAWDLPEDQRERLLAGLAAIDQAVDDVIRLSGATSKPAERDGLGGSS